MNHSINRQSGAGYVGVMFVVLLVVLVLGFVGKAYDEARGLIGKISIWAAESKGIPKIAYSPLLAGKVEVSCKNKMIAWMGEIPKVATWDAGGFGGIQTRAINQDLPAATLMQRSGEVTCSIQNKSVETMHHGAFGIYLSRDGQNVSKRPDRFHPMMRELPPGAAGETSFELKDFEGIALIYVGANPFKQEMEHLLDLWKIAMRQCGSYPNGGTPSQRQKHDRCAAPLWKNYEAYGKALQERKEAVRNESIPINSL
ncbi:hypothetical protein MASR1M60_05360 [Rhodocyclaceae bacterium]